MKVAYKLRTQLVAASRNERHVQELHYNDKVREVQGSTRRSKMNYATALIREARATANNNVQTTASRIIKKTIIL